jgi:hypothetical protein
MINMNLKFKMIVLCFSLIFLLLQLFFYVARDFIAEEEAAWLSLFSALFLILTASLIKLSAKNWMLWFSVLFFLLHQFGPMIGMTIIGTEESYIDYATTFGDGVSNYSRVTSYLLSGIAASFLAILCFFFPPKTIIVPDGDKDLEKISSLIWLLSTPFVFVHYFWLFNVFSDSYALLYSADAKELKSIVPYHWVFTNLFSIGFFLWFASVPTERKFKKGFYIFLLASFISSLHGPRINFVIPFIFILWYRAIVYGREITKKSFYIGCAFLLLFLFLVESARSGSNYDPSLLISFLTYSLSKAQHILSVYIENKDLIDIFGSHYWLAPLIFPYDYLIHGNALIGQGNLSGIVRGDLVHVMPATLNYEAYIAGAGTGSSLVAEAYQYGLIGMFPLLIIFYFFYRGIFLRTSKRIIFLISPLIFMHFIFAGRDSMFVNSWGILKLIFAYCVLRYLIAKLHGRIFRNP